MNGLMRNQTGNNFLKWFITFLLCNQMSALPIYVSTRVTRLADLLHFGQIFKACGNNFFTQIDHILANFWKVVKIFHISLESFLGNFYRHLATFYWSHCYQPGTYACQKRGLRMFKGILMVGLWTADIPGVEMSTYNVFKHQDNELKWLPLTLLWPIVILIILMTH